MSHLLAATLLLLLATAAGMIARTWPAVLGRSGVRSFRVAKGALIFWACYELGKILDAFLANLGAS